MRLSSRLLAAPLAAAALLVFGVSLAAAQDSGVVKPGAAQVIKPSQDKAAPGPHPGTRTKPGTVTQVMGASVNVDCGDGRKISVSTGTDSGSCEVITSDSEGGGKKRQVDCHDDKGNSGSASCNSKGMGGCEGSNGHGTCTEQ